MKNKIISILWLVLLSLGLLIPVFLTDSSYSSVEKRKLETFPTFRLEDFWTGEYTSKLEKYFEDQFVWRECFVNMKTTADYLVGKRDSNGVYFGKDGFLIEMHETLNVDQGKKNLAALTELQTKLDEKGIPMWCIAVPTASQVMTDKLPDFAGNNLQVEWINTMREAGLNVVDVNVILRAHADEYIFYRTDHHWTSLGAYYAYVSWCEAHGKTAEPLSVWTSEILCKNFLGTTYAKVNIWKDSADTITAYYKTLEHQTSYNNDQYITNSIYERRYLDGVDQYAVFFNSNQATTVTAGGGTGKILIIKDSYANTFAQFVVDDYEETHMIDMRFFKGKISDYIEENGITEVLVLYNIPNMTEDLKLQFVR